MKLITSAIFLIIILSMITAVFFWEMRIFIVSSGSMEPDLSRGDVIITKKKERYKLSDIVSYKNDHSQAVVTHHISSITLVDGSSWYKTKGAANKTEDAGLVSQDEIIGAVALTVPELGQIFLLPKRIVLLGTTWSLSLLIIAFELKQLVVSLRTYFGIKSRPRRSINV